MLNKTFKSIVFTVLSLVMLVSFNVNLIAGNEGLQAGETIPNPEILIQNMVDYDRVPRPVKLHDYKEGKNLLLAFMPDITDKNNYAKIMASAFDTYFAEGLAFNSPFLIIPGNQELKILVITNNNESEVKQFLSGLQIDFDMTADINMDAANFFGINKWNSSSEGSFVYVVNSNNVITYSSHNYKGEGEKLKAVQKELFSVMNAEESTVNSFIDYSPLMPGDKSRDFSYSYLDNNQGGFSNPELMETGKLSDFIGKKNVILAFYPAPFSMSCSFEATKFDTFAEERSIKNFANSQLASDENLEIMMISVTNGSILAKWKQEMNLKNLTLVSDLSGEISALYGSYNPLGYNKRTLFLIDKAGNVSYIDWDYRVDETDFALVKDYLGVLN